LLKLIHAQRLLPLEELLSGVAAGSSGISAARGAPAAAPPRPIATASRPAPALASAASPAPSISPFGPTGGGWSSGAKMDSGLKPESAAGPVATMEHAAIAANPVTASESAGSPFPAAASTGYASTLTDGALAKAPEAAPFSSGAPSMEAVRHAVGSALVSAGHSSAAQLLGAGAWTVDGASLRIEVSGVGKKMLALTVNAAAEKIIRQELQRCGAPTRFLVVPGEATGGTGQAATLIAAPIAGSIQEAALANPLVQRATEIFKAEVRSVVDLRQK
jgi:DNA polymerase-3 subunit gamma/tau